MTAGGISGVAGALAGRACGGGARAHSCRAPRADCARRWSQGAMTEWSASGVIPAASVARVVSWSHAQLAARSGCASSSSAAPMYSGERGIGADTCVGRGSRRCGNRYSSGRNAESASAWRTTSDTKLELPTTCTRSRSAMLSRHSHVRSPRSLVACGATIGQQHRCHGSEGALGGCAAVGRGVPTPASSVPLAGAGEGAAEGVAAAWAR